MVPFRNDTTTFAEDVERGRCVQRFDQQTFSSGAVVPGDVGNGLVERARPLGPRALLTLDEAAAVLDRSREGVERAIGAGFLRTARRNGRRYVTMKACRGYMRERQADMTLMQAHAREAVTPAEEVYRQLGV